MGLDRSKGLEADSKLEGALVGALPLEAGLGFRMSRAVRVMRKLWSDELIQLGLTPAQAAVLRAVALSPASSVRSLARVLDSDPMNVKRCIDELERRGLLCSGVRSVDRRSRRVSLTEGGAELVRTVDHLVRKQQMSLEIALGPTNLHLLGSILDQLEEFFEIGGAQMKATCGVAGNEDFVLGVGRPAESCDSA